MSSSKNVKAELLGHRNEVQVLKLLPNCELASGSLDNTIKIWNYERAQLNFTLVGHKDNILVIEVLPDYEIASGSADRTIRIWNTQTGK